MKTQITKIGMMLVAFLLFSYLGQAQMTIVPATTAACSDSSGAVTFTASGGTGTNYYTLYYYAGSSYYQFPTQTSPTFTNLWGGGLYKVYVYNNTDSGSYIFNIPTVVSGLISFTNATCAQSNGSVTVTLSGGTTPYSYQWNTGTTANPLTNVPAGNYYCTITDAHGCTAYLDTTVQSISSDSASIHVTGNACNPILSAFEFGGTGPYEYYWNTGDTGQTIAAYGGNVSYAVTVVDANGCGATAYATVNTNGIQFDSIGGGVVNPGCNASDGSITVGVSNGTGPYSFVWSNGETTGTDSNLAPGSYSVTVTDANGCTATESYSLSNQTGIYAYMSSVYNPGCGQSNGGLSVYAYNSSWVQVTNGTYLWSNGGTNDSIANVPAGTYTVTVTIPGGCSATASYSLTGTANYTVSVTTTPTGCDTALATGTATAVITGTGTPPYTFSWTAWTDSSGFWVNELLGTTQTVSGLPYGESVNVMVTDASGCTALYDSAYGYVGMDPACFDQITGYVYNDSNGNCIRDTGEAGLVYAYVIATSSTGQTYYGNPNAAGFFDIEVTPGIYTVSVTIYNYGSCAVSPCANEYTDTFTTTGQVSSGNNFGIGTGGGAFNLGVHPGCYPSSPGSQKEYWVYYYNYGLTPAYNCVVSFTHDPNLTLVSTNPAYSNYDAATHVISWFVGTVPAGGSWTQITMEFDVPSTLTLGTILYAQAEIDPISGDCDPSNNIVSCTQPVTGSQDPNEKSVVPAGNLSATDTTLTYTIRFQNVGNAPANTIVVIDTLSPNVNPATVVPGASSAPYTFTISGNGVMTFTFQGINLPDTSHGSSSIGFVTYTVNTKPNLPIGTTINNTAYVYFDANAAVVTNTTTNERSNVNGINTINATMNAEVVPNPAHDIAEIMFNGATGNIALQITDAMGNVIATSNVSSQAYTLNAAGLASGIYFYTARDTNGNKASGKISVVH